MHRWPKRLLWTVVALLGVVALERAYRPPAVLVDVAAIRRASLVVTVDDDGRTRVQDRYTVSAPIGGRLLRPTLKAGAVVRAQETVLTELEPLPSQLLDARTRAEAAARVARARAARDEAQAREATADADLRYATADLERRCELLKGGAEAQAEVDRAERDERRAAGSLRAARFALQVAEHELRLAEAGLLDDPAEGQARRIELRSPVDGQVLRVFEESARSVPAGAPIVEVGDTAALEVVADFLSQAAVQVRPGMKVLVEGFGGRTAAGVDQVLHGEVAMVEPAGFTKISALGVEEQRVNIVVDPVGPAEGWALLRDGYRVELRIVIWEQDDVVIVPTGALFREGSTWAVFVVTAGLARRREVSLGRRNGLEAEVLAGLEVGEQVVLYPSELVADGAKVQVRRRE